MIRGFRRRRARARLAKAGADPRLLEYLERDFALPRGQPLHEARFVVLDSETTGLDPAQDCMLSFAAVAVQGGVVRLDDRLELTVHGQSVGGHSSAPVHGMVTRDLAAGLPEQEAILQIVAYLRADVVVAHHAAFDVMVMSKALERLEATGIDNPIVDTGHLARRLDKGPVMDAPVPEGARSLDALSARFGFEITDRHSASGDALVTAYVLLALLKKAHARGIRTLSELLAR